MALKDTSALYLQAQTKGLAIAFFRLPGRQKIDHICGATARKIPEGQKAFVFAPFDSSIKPYYILPEGKEGISRLSSQPQSGSTSQKAFLDFVKSIIKVINTGTYRKVVAARILSTDKPLGFEAVSFFEKLCRVYPAAFVSLSYIPDVGLWIGASPEILVSQGNSSLTTYSLAGTKTIDDPSDWNDKEKQEQKIVTDFIADKLSKFTDTDVKVKGPVTHEAGKLKHLLSIFTLRSKENNLWQKVAKALHPTPAVGGMPQAKSGKFIKANESFDRKFYAGYLGPVNWAGKTDVFVNLRCMEVTDRQLIFYAGCGITADSDPAKEWLESERKIDVLKSLL